MKSEFKHVRPAAVAGRFYPSDPAELRELVEGLLAKGPKADGPAPKAIIAPHAGYMFSGPIAASGYAQFMPDRTRIKRIVLLGPSHYVPFDGVAANRAEAFATPLGLVPVDTESVRYLVEAAQVTVLEQAHVREHSLEVQLPFLQVLLGAFSVVPLVAGEAAPEELSRLLETLWGGPETRFVISSDLSHNLTYDEARQIDCASAKAIEQLNIHELGENTACGGVPVKGLLAAATQRGLKARTVDLRSSGDTGGPRDRVVGYGAFAFQ